MEVSLRQRIGRLPGKPGVKHYSKILQIIQGDFVAEQVQQSILEHAAMAVTASYLVSACNAVQPTSQTAKNDGMFKGARHSL
jgi:hypothetical protein